MKIANIIYENELVNHTEVEYVNYFKGPQEYDKVDKTLPTLYVGWSFMKSCNPENPIIKNADILKKRIISNELYWELSYEESKTSHVKGVSNFINLVPQFYFLPKYVFTNLDPVFFGIQDIEELLLILSPDIDATYQYKDEMLYVLSENKIWSINLKMFEFFQFSVDEILSRIQERSTSTTIDFEGLTYQKYYKIFPNFAHLKRYIITL